MSACRLLRVPWRVRACVRVWPSIDHAPCPCLQGKGTSCGWDDSGCKTPPHTRCDGFRGTAATAAGAGAGLQRRLYLACLAGSTMANTERMIASLKEPKVEAFAASCAAEIAAGDREAFGACLSPIVALIGGPDCLPDILGIAQ